MEAVHPLTRAGTLATANNAERQFARVVKGVDLRSTEGNFAWAQTPQLTTLPLKTCAEGPCRLVVRTSRCGRDNPGSNPGKDIERIWLFREARFDVSTGMEPKTV